MRKPDFCIWENKDTDQLRGNREADHAFVFTIQIVQSIFYLNPKFQASSHLPDLCRTWSETTKTGFLTTRLISKFSLGSLAGWFVSDLLGNPEDRLFFFLFF